MKCDDCGAEGATVHVLTDDVLCWRCHWFHVAWVFALGMMVSLAYLFVRGLVAGDL